MRKIFSILMLAFAMVLSTNTVTAQHVGTKFTDNVSVEVRGGVSTPLLDMYKGVSPLIGIQVEKYVTPWLGFAVDANTLISNPYGSNNPHTMFDVVNVNMLAKVNLLNTFNYNGERKFFEPVLFAGMGCGHRTCKEYATIHEHGKNYVVSKAGVELNFNLDKEKAWGVRISPAVVWGPVECGRLDARTGEFEITAGITYHFKGSNGKRYFTKARLYDYDEVRQLNETIKALTKENEKNKRVIANQRNELSKHTELVKSKSEVVHDTVYMTLNSKVFFKVGSAVITSKAAVRDLASRLKENTKYVVTGYASEDGPTEYNQTLSENRAKNLMSMLIKYGVNPDNITFVGKGETTQFSTTDRSQNRVAVVDVQ